MVLALGIFRDFPKGTGKRKRPHSNTPPRSPQSSSRGAQGQAFWMLQGLGERPGQRRKRRRQRHSGAEAEMMALLIRPLGFSFPGTQLIFIFTFLFLKCFQFRSYFNLPFSCLTLAFGNRKCSLITQERTPWYTGKNTLLLPLNVQGLCSWLLSFTKHLSKITPNKMFNKLTYLLIKYLFILVGFFFG